MIKKTVSVTVEIDGYEFLEAFLAKLAEYSRSSDAKEKTFFRALSHLVGLSVPEAVGMANNGLRKEDRITSDEFRRWLPDFLSCVFKDVVQKREE